MSSPTPPRRQCWGLSGVRRSRSCGRRARARVGRDVRHRVGLADDDLRLNPFDVYLLHTATTLPIFLFTLPAGAVADIVDPRRMIVAVSYAIAAMMTIFAAVVALDFASPSCSYSRHSSQRGLVARYPGMVVNRAAARAEGRYPGAIAAHSVGYNLSRTIGPALGGFIIAKYGSSHSAMDFCRRSSGGDRRARLVARAEQAKGVPSSRKTDQCLSHRAQTYGEQSPALGDTRSHDCDLLLAAAYWGSCR